MPAQKGFTLVELLVTISIIAVLSVVGTVSFIGIRNKALDTKKKADIDAIRKAYEQNYDPTANGGQGGYKPLSDSQFASGKIPTPDGTINTSYICRIGPGTACAKDDNQGYRIDAPLSDGTTYKAISNQGTLPAEQLNSCDPAGSLSQDLVGYWKMDDPISDGSMIADYTNSFPGTVQNGAGSMSSVDSKSGFNKAVRSVGTAGTGNRIYLGTINDGKMSPFKTKKFTISALIKRDTGSCGIYNICDIFSIISTDLWMNGFAFRLIDSGSDSFLRLSVSNNGWRITTQNSVSRGTWHHVAVVLDVDHSSDAKLYVDGVSQALNSDRGSGSPSLNYPSGANQNVLIGNGYSTFYTPFNGLIDDVAFYDRVLSAEEIQTLANRTIACP